MTTELESPKKSKSKVKLPDINLEMSVKLLSKGRAEIVLPLKTVSEANCFESWHTKHKRHKIQKKMVFYAMLQIKHLIGTPCIVTITRYAPGSLDSHDNLPISQKYVADSIAAEITGDYRPGRADCQSQFTWKYDQVKNKKYGIKIVIEWNDNKDLLHDL